MMLAVQARAAQPGGDEGACGAAIAAAERAVPLPPELMGAIAVVESGRPVGGRVVPWPWTIDVGGAGEFFASKADAIAAVRTLQAAGVRSIDVGCMQVNLLQHPDAFASLDQAFDPRANARYAARFLAALYRGSANWPAATASYHSTTPALAQNYERRVMAVWPLASAYGGDLPIVRPAGIDPDHVLTAAFRSRLSRDLAERTRLVARLRGVPAMRERPALLRLSSAEPVR